MFLSVRIPRPCFGAAAGEKWAGSVEEPARFKRLALGDGVGVLAQKIERRRFLGREFWLHR